MTPAFPINAMTTDEGMTLRDYFAANAMQVLKDSVWDFELLSKEAYEMADAMMKAREA